jgi:hypothetical protein
MGPCMLLEKTNEVISNLQAGFERDVGNAAKAMDRSEHLDSHCSRLSWGNVLVAVDCSQEQSATTDASRQIACIVHSEESDLHTSSLKRSVSSFQRVTPFVAIGGEPLMDRRAADPIQRRVVDLSFGECKPDRQ